jgi:hypothetical protein
VRYALTLSTLLNINFEVYQLGDISDFSEPDPISRGTGIEKLTVSPALTFILEYFHVTLITYYSYLSQSSDQ